jgi:antitoxin MazE
MQSKHLSYLQTQRVSGKDRAKTTISGKNPRKGWAESAAKIAAAGDDKLLIPDVLEDENFDDWVNLSDESK